MRCTIYKNNRQTGHCITAWPPLLVLTIATIIQAYVLQRALPLPCILVSFLRVWPSGLLFTNSMTINEFPSEPCDTQKTVFSNVTARDPLVFQLYGPLVRNMWSCAFSPQTHKNRLGKIVKVPKHIAIVLDYMERVFVRVLAHTWTFSGLWDWGARLLLCASSSLATRLRNRCTRSI